MTARLARAPRLAAVAVAVALLAAACGESTGPQDPGATTLRVTGTIRNVSGAAIPSGARVIAVWGVSSGSPDYSYVFGEGTVDAATNTFTLELDRVPPAEALNDGRLGVATIFLVGAGAPPPGRMSNDYPTTSIIGAAARYGIIYLGDDPSRQPDWVRTFPRGYAVGVGVTQPGSSFDGFTRAPADDVEIVIDDLENLEFVNWT